jgi:hypothetical protein
MLSSVYLAAEDEPGLAVGRKLVTEAAPLFVYREENAHGFGRLKMKTRNFQQMGSHGLPVLMITDLDAHICPPSMITEWLGSPPTEGFLFRVCVREVETWLLAHRSAIADFLSVPISRLPAAPELLPDPKAELIALAQRSSLRKIRTGFKPIGSSTIGPDYNRFLGDFIRDRWISEVAAQASPSLARARARLRMLANTVRALQPPQT